MPTSAISKVPNPHCLSKLPSYVSKSEFGFITDVEIIPNLCLNPSKLGRV
jgi:hypothetical protein